MIQWISKKRVKNSDIMSISIHVYSDGVIDIGFHGDAHKKITVHDYVQFGLDFSRNRIYFRAATSVNGYKLHYVGKIPHIRAKNDFSAKLRSVIGVYDLLYDDEERYLYYIQLGDWENRGVICSLENC